MEPFSRTELQELRDRARELAHYYLSPWNDALLDLAQAADRMDAIMGRAEWDNSVYSKLDSALIDQGA